MAKRGRKRQTKDGYKIIGSHSVMKGNVLLSSLTILCLECWNGEEKDCFFRLLDVLVELLLFDVS